MKFALMSLTLLWMLGCDTKEALRAKDHNELQALVRDEFADIDRILKAHASQTKGLDAKVSEGRRFEAMFDAQFQVVGVCNQLKAPVQRLTTKLKGFQPRSKFHKRVNQGAIEDLRVVLQLFESNPEHHIYKTLTYQTSLSKLGNDEQSCELSTATRSAFHGKVVWGMEEAANTLKQEASDQPYLIPTTGCMLLCLRALETISLHRTVLGGPQPDGF